MSDRMCYVRPYEAALVYQRIEVVGDRRAPDAVDVVCAAVSGEIVFLSVLTVRGSGPFPLDELRHNMCWPMTELDSVTMMSTDLRVVNLYRVRCYPGRTADAERWASVGWTVLSEIDEATGRPTGSVLVAGATVTSQETTMNDDFKRGAVAAADVASTFDSSSTHTHRLGDCILGKLNLRASKPRRNKAKVETPDKANLRGFALALAEVARLLNVAGHDTGLCQIARDGGLTLATARAAGVDPYDLKALRKMGVR